MKKLYDGTEVEDSVPTKATPNGRYLLSQAEIDQRAVDDAKVPKKQTVITYEDFQDRFTVAEFDAATDLVYGTSPEGKPNQKGLLQILSRSIARNSVDLLDPKTTGFLTALVAGSVITEQRKTEIITP